MLDERPGVLTFRVQGPAASAVFANEAGGHRWQRVPPTEKRGRVHTSTITVAVLPEPAAAQLHVPDADIDWQATRGSGPGGQHRNKTSTAVIATHRPTGLQVRVDGGRSQHQNREAALALLRARLFAQEDARRAQARASERRRQMGCGARGDKRRTISVPRGEAVDHLLDRRWPLRDYLRGEWE